ncbi:MAG: peptide-methionine (S)-S-oxide reductase, partial [Candidatus Competibacteraceae bacterium]|nr:peptide-methionine (S)-S-oxide reductase [Candidatus Competibacteraceae bacterium]
MTASILATGLLALSAIQGAVAQQTDPQQDLARATFAGGCFWCMEPPYDKLPGVISTTSGYIGGEQSDPTSQEVSAGNTGHSE